MVIVGMKNGHDGSIAVIEDRELRVVCEAEKNSNPRHMLLLPESFISAARFMNRPPDVVAQGGWHRRSPHRIQKVGAGYFGLEASCQRVTVCGRDVALFDSSHERSHIMMAVGMGPKEDGDRIAVVVYEGDIGSLYMTDAAGKVLDARVVMSQPGARYASLYGIIDQTFPPRGSHPRLDDAGKLMALAAFGNADDADDDVRGLVDQLLTLQSCYPVPKYQFAKSPICNAGTDAPAARTAAALLSCRIFDRFVAEAMAFFPPGLPLRISGGCGLNCEWNYRWRECGHFSSVFVPPCTDDSGSAIGTALDALATFTGDPTISWNVYSGLPFQMDADPPSPQWERRPLVYADVAAMLGRGRILCWVQGRTEIGPRALGNRSLLAEPRYVQTRNRLNALKGREPFRPIAPCCRLVDSAKYFDGTFADPYMLYFRKVRSEALAAVTHVDGSARVQTVTHTDNPQLDRLLGAFADLTGIGVLCNTSLNFKGHGFINSMADLLVFSDLMSIDDLVVDDIWYHRHRSAEGSAV